MTRTIRWVSVVAASLALACSGDDVAAGSGGAAGASAGSGGIGGAAGVGGSAGAGGVAGAAGAGGVSGVGGIGGSSGTGGDGGIGGASGVGGASGAGGTPGAPRNLIEVAGHVCAISVTDQVVCWVTSRWHGLGPAKQIQATGNWACALGLDDKPKCDAVGAAVFPVWMHAPDVAMVDIAITDPNAGSPFGCGIAVDGRTLCWNANGLAREEPAGVVLDVAGSEETVCELLAADGSIVCRRSVNAVPHATLVGPFVQAAAGRRHACGLRPDGRAGCLIFTGATALPPAPPGPFVQVAAGRDFACAIRTDGDVECWGNGDIDTPPPGPYEEIALDTFACGIRSRGDVVCWKGPLSTSEPPEPPQDFIPKTGP